MKNDVDLINLKDYIDKIKEVINRIFNIIKKYNYSLKEEEKIVRINELYRYDSRLLRQTLREPKFFKKINDDLKPEYLYSYDLIDNIDTYENRFIKYLINLIKRNLVIILKTFKPLNISQILNGKLSFTYYGNYKNLSYLDNDNDISDIYNDLEDINHKINLIMKTNYYKHINNVIFNEVIVTNLLNDDSNYNYCYRFYLIKNNYYPNFINKLINDLRLNTNIIKDVKTIKNGEFKNFICSYNGFILTLNSNLNNLKVNIKINDLEENYNISLVENSYLPILKINETNIPLLFVLDYSNIILTLIFSVLNKNNSCPYCGEILNEDNCSYCGLKYKKYIKDNNEYLWIINLLDLPIGGDLNA